jgi:hypothetical protein
MTKPAKPALQVSSDDSIAMAKRLAKEVGLKIAQKRAAWK